VETLAAADRVLLALAAGLPVLPQEWAVLSSTDQTNLLRIFNHPRLHSSPMFAQLLWLAPAALAGVLVPVGLAPQLTAVFQAQQPAFSGLPLDGFVAHLLQTGQWSALPDPDPQAWALALEHYLHQPPPDDALLRSLLHFQWPFALPPTTPLLGFLARPTAAPPPASVLATPPLAAAIAHLLLATHTLPADTLRDWGLPQPPPATASPSTETGFFRKLTGFLRKG
jgi:hypothetical protein